MAVEIESGNIAELLPHEKSPLSSNLAVGIAHLRSTSHGPDSEKSNDDEFAEKFKMAEFEKVNVS
jgi:hypothetical protein